MVRHGQVYNPEGVLYGRLPGFRLSELGQQMAQRLGEYFADFPITHLASSPLQRAQETMAPIAAAHPDLTVEIDSRLIEAWNFFEGQVFGTQNRVLYNPKYWWQMRNPFRPSWCEPYQQIAARMRAAIKEMARKAAGGQAVMLSHQLPIWIARCSAEGRPLIHDPRRRECSLASVTSFTFIDQELSLVSYAEPVKDLVPPKVGRKFKVGT